MGKAEEEHARRTLADELGVDFCVHDDGSRPGMPDLLSVDKRHVAEVITTVPPAVREAAQHLKPMAEERLPHCVWVTIPYTRLGGATKDARRKIEADVLRWTVEAGCDSHWSSLDQHQLLPGSAPALIRGLGAYDDGVKAACVQSCEHPIGEPHQIRWSVGHAPSSHDPWSLIRQSLHIVETEQRGGVQALADKLHGYGNKHLVIYPFGPPGNLTAAFSTFMPPPDPRDLLPPRLNPPLTDVHVWLIYQYDNCDVTEGLHLCNGHWARFGTTLPKNDQTSLFRALHYGEV